MSTHPADARPFLWEKVLIGLLVLLMVAFGVVTEIRSAFLSFRHTDFNVYTHVGWAVRTGEDIYGAIATNGLPYTYPSLFSLLMVPFAETPPWAPAKPGEFYLPYAVSVGVWYVLSVFFAACAVHLLARAVLPDAVRGSRRWWYARTVPFCVCIGGIGFSLGRGQVNLMIVAMFAASFAASVRGRRIASGVWLGFTVVFKLIPGIMLLFPLLRKDWRAGVGVVIASILGLVVIPVAVWGPQRVVAQHEFFVKHVVLAGTTGAGDHAVGKALTETNATDSQSFVAALHHIRHRHTHRDHRPPHASKGDRLAHWAISGALVLITIAVVRRRLTPAPADQLVFFGCLCALMMVVSPVSHMHYYAFVLPLVSGVWLRSVAARPGAVFADRPTQIVLGIWGIATALPLFPGQPFDTLREVGLGAAATVLLWGYGLAVMGKKAGVEVVQSESPRLAA